MISSGIDAVIPTKNIGPILLNWQNEKHEIFAPLTTLETPLWYSVNRGASEVEHQCTCCHQGGDYVRHAKGHKLGECY